MVLTWKKTNYFSSDRFTPAHFWIGWDPKSVHRIPRISDGQIPGDPHRLRMEKHQPVPGDPLCCPSPWGEALQPPWALCRGRDLERHGGSVRNPLVTSGGLGGWELLQWQQQHSCLFLQSNLQSADKYKSEIRLARRIISLSMIKQASTSREKANSCALHCLESLQNSPTNCLLSVHFHSK